MAKLGGETCKHRIPGLAEDGGRTARGTDSLVAFSPESRVRMEGGGRDNARAEVGAKSLSTLQALHLLGPKTGHRQGVDEIGVPSVQNPVPRRLELPGLSPLHIPADDAVWLIGP